MTRATQSGLQRELFLQMRGKIHPGTQDSDNLNSFAFFINDKNDLPGIKDQSSELNALELLLGKKALTSVRKLLKGLYAFQNSIALAFCGDGDSTVNGQISSELYKILTGFFGNSYFVAHFLKMRSVSFLTSSKENVSSVFRELYPSKTSETNCSSVIRAGINGSFFDFRSKGNLCSAIDRIRNSLTASERLMPSSSNKAAAFCFISSETRTLRKVFELTANNCISPICVHSVHLNNPLLRRTTFSLLLLVSLAEKPRLSRLKEIFLCGLRTFARKIKLSFKSH